MSDGNAGMVNPEEYLHSLQDAGVEFITGVPDTLLNDLCLAIEERWPASRHVLAANEGNAITLAAGYHLATGTVPLIYMQNSGLGNAMNPLISLVDRAVYAIPMVLLVGWRGDPTSPDWPQHVRQGEVTPGILSDMDVPFRFLEPDDEMILNSIEWAVSTAKERSGPVALLARTGVFDLSEKSDFGVEDGPYLVSREEAMASVLDIAPKNTIFVATTGRATRELYELREARRESHENDFLNVGAMGHTSSIAAGIAMAKPGRTVICFDGDSAALMHMGCFAINASLKLPNFIHIILNNGAHESVGGQTSVGHRVDFTEIAAAAGYRTCRGWVSTQVDLQNSTVELLSKGGPALIDMRIRKGMRKDIPKLVMIPLELKTMLMEELG